MVNPPSPYRQLHLWHTKVGTLQGTVPCKELSPVSKPVYKDKLLENIHIKPYHSNVIPGSSAFFHISQMAANARIIKALELGFPLAQQAQDLSRAYLHNSKETNDS
jgi:hypothetical protein